MLESILELLWEINKQKRIRRYVESSDIENSDVVLGLDGQPRVCNKCGSYIQNEERWNVCGNCYPDWRDEEKLREMYIEQDMTGPEIADALDCTPGTIYRWMNKFDIERE